MSFIDDVRYAVRGLMRRPALLIVTTIALSIGIAANTIMFGVVDQLLVRPPAHVAAPDDVRRIYYQERLGGTPVTTYPLITALRENVPAFSAIAAFSFKQAYSMGRGAEARSVDVQLVSGNYFNLLGVRPVIGRAFAPDEDRIPVGKHVAIISDGFWKREMGAADDVAGKSLYLQGKPFTVIGVAPHGFAGIDRQNVDVWLPISSMADESAGAGWHNKTNSWWVQAIGRIRSDATPELAAAQATVAYRAFFTEHKDTGRDSTGSVVVGSLVGTRRPGGLSPESKVSLWLMGVSAIVLLIACANVANLLIARMLQRRREIAVRLALGVSRGRLLRLLLTEAALLATLGAAVALAVAYGASRVVQRLLLPQIVWSESVLDARVLSFTVMVTVVCIILAGIAPALQGVSTRVSDGLKTSSHQVAGGRGRLRFALLILQAALSIVLLIGAGLFVKSLRNVVGRDVGIDLDRVLMITTPLRRFGFDSNQIEDVYRRGAERLRVVPGVENVSVVRQSVPMGSANAWGFSVPGVKRPDLPGGGPYNSVVTSEFFATVGARILRGRSFTQAEEHARARVVIVNEMLAKAYWPAADPLGQCVTLGADSTCSEIVGVVENVLQFRLVRDDRALVYLPPSHPAVRPEPPSAMLVRAAGSAKPLIPVARKEMQQLAPNMPFVQVRTYSDIVAPQLQPWKLGATMFTLFGVIAVIIAAVGLFSVMAYWVSQRTQEIGVRMALGAQRSDVIRLVAWQSSRAIAIGLVLGVLAAAFASRWVAEMLYETSPRDPVVYAGAAAVLALAAFVASVVPARRSAAVDPALALRAE